MWDTSAAWWNRREVTAALSRPDASLDPTTDHTEIISLIDVHGMLVAVAKSSHRANDPAQVRPSLDTGLVEPACASQQLRSAVVDVVR